MKVCAPARTLLGFLLFLTELGIFVLLASGLRIGEKEILLFSAVYFLLLIYEGHFSFASVLIWHEVVELIRIHGAYWAVCLVTGIYLNSNQLLQFTMLTVCMFFVCILTERAFRLLTRKRLGFRVVVVGAGKSAEDIHILFNRNRFLYINPIAYVNLEAVTGTAPSGLIARTATVITPDMMEAFIRAHQVEELYIADNRLTAETLEEITRNLRDKVPVIRYRPEMKSILPGNVEVAHYDESIFTVITDIRRSSPALFLRRLLDILVGLAGCLVLLPVSLAVKIGALATGDKESIFFTQDRFGKDGKLIKIYKYRTMVPNAEQILEEMMAHDPKIREEYLTHKKLNPDPRVTPFGHILRKNSLDELPQLINILKGDMSLIGPRPYLPREKDDMGFRYDVIVRFKPGLTGLWQTSGRSNISFTERCKLDEYYYYNRSFWLDVIILVKTVKAVFLREGSI